uniref:Tryptophan synthase alpha chain n=1 Tax=Helminthocladia australis TaxID=260093 RepID=A0A1G4NTE3_9FLOR|nr:Tryptophan synthase alpha subunit [Helminthocladia australis]SCW21907.1 Tryptophan synthase alpha subunit [Helminthocladia australis]
MAIISSTLRVLQETCGLIPFITAGSPNVESTEKALKLLDHSGADIIEIGLPYSDPLADGPIIQEASKEALQQGMNFDLLLELLDRVKGTIRAPIVLFTYYNPILARGIKSFIEDIARAGVQGLIVPDLPLEETDYMISLCNELSIELILLITPTSPPQRIKDIIQKSPGLIYIVSSTGVTGIRHKINHDMGEFVDRIKLQTDKLLIMGFGISNTEHVKQVMQWNIDGIVIGSAFVKCLSDVDIERGLANLEQFCLSVKKTLRK